MSRPKPNHRVELKYCEGCGCLLTRPVGSALTFCALCEAKSSKDLMFLTLPKRLASRPARLPKRVDLQGGVETNGHPAEECA